MMLSKIAMIAVCLGGITVSGVSSAQSDYPSHPIKLIIPFGPGGSADLAARVVARKLSELTNQAVISENRPGANSNIGADAVAKATPDGYTMLYNTQGVIFNIHLYKKLSYDLFRDLTPVALTAKVPQILLVTPSVPAKTLKEFIAYAKTNDGKLNYASVGVGSLGHLSSALFLERNGISATHVAYTKSGPAYTDLIAGRTQFSFGTVSSARPYVLSNKLRGIAVTSLERTTVFPDMPTMDASGMPKFEAGSWQGIMVPAGTPMPVIRRLNQEIVKAVNSEEVKQAFATQGTISSGSTPEEYGAFLKNENALWGKIIGQSNLKKH